MDMKQLCMGLVCLILTGALAQNVTAQVVDENKAYDVAKNFFEANLPDNGALKSTANLPKLVHKEFISDDNSDMKGASVAPAFYVYNRGESDGFVVIAGDERVAPILGYSATGAIDFNNLPPALQRLFKDYKAEISMIATDEDFTDANKNVQWEAAATKSKTLTSGGFSLIESNWEQGCDYNAFCPTDKNSTYSSCERVPVGCVALASAMIMKYWEWPVKGVGNKCYTSGEYGELCAEFGNTSYDWNNMPAALNSGSTQQQIDAVAELIYHCAVMVNMNFGPNSSSASSYYVKSKLPEYFDYSSKIDYVSRSDYSDSDWEDLLKSHLDNGIPVYMRGSDPENGGHAFVCDGYDDSGMYHINWGWGAYFNGYFALDNLSPYTGYNFSTSTSAIINIFPDLEDYVVENSAVNELVLNPGQSVAVSCDQKYNGYDFVQVKPKVGYYLSTNNVLDGSDILLGADESVLSKSVNTENEQATVVIPHETTPGDYYILFVADYEKRIAEKYENNNVESVAITIEGHEVEEPTYHEITLNTVSLEEAEILVGNSSTVSWNIVYNGNSDEAVSFTNKVYLSSDSEIDNEDVLLVQNESSLSTKQKSEQKSEQFTIPAETSPGAYKILIAVDSENSIEETNETNNVASLSLNVTVPLTSDFYITELSVSPSNVNYNETIEIACRHNYEGNDPELKIPYVGFYLSSDKILDAEDMYLEDEQSSLSSNDLQDPESSVVTIPEGLTSGTYYILAVADYKEAYVEVDENNNISTFPIHIAEPVLLDFSVSNSVASSSSVEQGSSLEISFEQQLDGEISNSVNCSVGIYLSKDQQPDSKDILLAEEASAFTQEAAVMNQGVTINIPESTEPGNYYLLIVIDDGQVVAESDESNNLAWLNLTVQEATYYELVLKNEQINNNDVFAGDNVVLSYDLEYTGTKQETLAPTVKFLLSKNMIVDGQDMELDGAVVTSVSGDDPLKQESITIQLPDDTDEGDYYLLFAADPDNQYSEKNEQDNVCSLQVHVKVCGDNLEPNDSNSSAYNLGEITDYLNADLCLLDGDEDWYNLTINSRSYYLKVASADNIKGKYGLDVNSSGDVITVETYLTDGATNTKIWLYDADMTLLAEDDNGGQDGFSKLDYTAIVTNNNLLKQDISMNVYPNPTTDWVNLEIGADIDEELSVLVFDTRGRLLKRENLDGNYAGESHRVDLTRYSPGEYLVAVQSSNKALFKQKIIKH
ncbi:T9SS type A sorting domain-containing protein [Puteibacter caeruleilacunae]|nr:T9SS type A sorting domain-containing protein [Puteibacter caeruleilacunae]